MTSIEITRHQFSNQRHSTSYLAAGPLDGPIAICVHGWPELSISWRNQLPFLAGLGYRAIAPDMRGYGASAVYTDHSDYRLEESVQDMLDLLKHIGRTNPKLSSDKQNQGELAALWIGHDWGAPVVWSLASHYPQHCSAVVNLCVPYALLERGLDAVIAEVDRDIYPADEYPAGQWEYMRFYEENFTAATKPMDANPRTFCQAIFRKGDPAGRGLPSATATVRQTGGWMGGLPEAPEVPRDDDVVSEFELEQYVTSLAKNGFAAANAWYMNHEANAAYAKQSVKHGVLEMPVLFMHAAFDYTCETLESTAADPMRRLSNNLTETTVNSGHWMAQEQPFVVNQNIAKWLVQQDLL